MREKPSFEQPLRVLQLADELKRRIAASQLRSRPLRTATEVIRSADRDDNRQEPRKRALRAARVILNRASTFDCTLRDISETGALLEFPAPVALPDEFSLRLLESRTIKPVSKVWQKGRLVGVEFTGEPQPAKA